MNLYIFSTGCRLRENLESSLDIETLRDCKNERNIVKVACNGEGGSNAFRIKELGGTFSTH